MITPENEGWLLTMEAAARYRVSTDMLRTWRKWREFPEEAVRREGNICVWHIDTIDIWLRGRRVHKVGRPPRWTDVVGHPEARST